MISTSNSRTYQNWRASALSLNAVGGFPVHGVLVRLFFSVQAGTLNVPSYALLEVTYA